MRASVHVLALSRSIAQAAPLLLLLAAGGCCRSSEATKDTSASEGASDSYSAGDRVQVSWKGKLYPAVILSAQGNNKYKIHYDGYESSWDEVVGTDRIKGRIGGPAPKAAAQNNQPAAQGNQMANDGLPAEIPEPGSKPPTVAEWNSVTREIRVKDSTPLNCETKMLREWLRVSCRPAANNLPPSNVQTVSSNGQQAFVGVFGDTTSAVVQVVRGKSYKALFTWGGGQIYVASHLIVDWPSGNPRPSIYFQDAKR